MRLLLLRHGQTHGNVAGALDTAYPGNELTGLGHRQADAAAAVLHSRPIEAIYVSNLTRTHQTAAPLAKRLGLAPTEFAGLREISAGDYEMKVDEDSVHGYLTTIGAWIHGDPSARMPGGETGAEFLERYDAAVRRAADSGHECLLVVSHGAAIRAWSAIRAEDADPQHATSQPLRNTGLIVLDGDPDSGWRLVDWHSDPVGGHLLEDRTAADPTGRRSPE
ncbi:MAG TPA: histidine phosphatase family protein [Marmoricola sp.]|nr:histidine phosphatase family protein [Marmoricola sp.]